MKSNHQILQELDEKERLAGLYDIVVDGIPFWKVVRFNIRINHLNGLTGFTNRTTSSKRNIGDILKYFFISFFQLSRVLISKKGRSNIFFAFPRLFNINSLFIDKFTDPVILGSNIKEDFYIFQHSFGRPHYKPRINNENTVYCDFIDIISRVLANVLIYFYFFNDPLNRIKVVYKDIVPKSVIKDFLIFKFSYIIYRAIFKVINVRNIFLVNRSVFDFVILSAKECDVNVYEFQHGITQSETPLYTGPFIDSIDPDFFLAFGSAWKNDFFGIPKEKIINIGWAYKDYIAESALLMNFEEKNTCLIISSPAITQKIIDLLINAVNFNDSLKFDIRLHPQEELNFKQKELISTFNNINIIDNMEESVFSILKYKTVLGDNSSVLYEALSMGKKVGKINMNGIYSRSIEDDIKHGFFVINQLQDFDELGSNSHSNSDEFFYSKFNKDLFNYLIK